MSDERKKYLMKRRRYGYGWIPVTWQGWLFLVLQAAIVVVAATALPAKQAQPTIGELVHFFLIVGFAIASLVLVSIQTSPSPKWRWGKKSSDNPEEDF